MAKPKAKHPTAPKSAPALCLVRLELPPADRDRFQRASDAEGRSMARQARKIILDWLDLAEKKS